MDIEIVFSFCRIDKIIFFYTMAMNGMGNNLYSTQKPVSEQKADA